MPVYKDMTFCSNEKCPNKECYRHLSHVPWDELPEWMCVSIADFSNAYERCKTNIVEENAE